MTLPRTTLRTAPGRVLAVVAVLAVSIVGAALPSTAVGAVASSSVSRTATDVAGYCSYAGGFQTNLAGTVRTLRVAMSPASPRAGAAVHIAVFVKQSQRTPAKASYPAGILRGQVVIGFGAKHHVLQGPVNAHAVKGVIFAKGWTARGNMTAPKAGRRALVVNRIVYNVRGGLSGGWDARYRAFDLVCSGGLNPTATVTSYASPRLTIKVRR